MKFIAFSEAAARKDTVVVDAYLPEKLNLSHWRGVELPSFLQADTSTEIVLNALNSGEFKPDAYQYCTNNHFDIDGFLGIWSLIHPEQAIKHADLLVQMAEIGDFREYDEHHSTADRALSLVCLINELEKSEFYAPFEMKIQEEEACLPKYDHFLREFDRMLAGEYKESQEFELVKKHIADLRAYGSVTYHPELKLLVVRAPYPMHYYALFGNSRQADMVLTIYPDNQYELEQKYSTWVQTVRPSFPRILLSDLAGLLNESEKSGYRWVGDHFTDTGPILRLSDNKLSKAARFDHPVNRHFHTSSIDEDTFVKTLVNYLSGRYQDINPKVNWTWEEVRAFNG